MLKCNKSLVVRFQSAMVTWFCVRPTSRRWFWEYYKWPWNMIHLMPCRNPCRLYIHLASTYSVGPWSAVWSELRPTPPFPPVRFSWSAMVTGPDRVSCVKWPQVKHELSTSSVIKQFPYFSCHAIFLVLSRHAHFGLKPGIQHWWLQLAGLEESFISKL
jgi:hypothetical protein